MHDIQLTSSGDLAATPWRSPRNCLLVLGKLLGNHFRGIGKRSQITAFCFRCAQGRTDVCDGDRARSVALDQHRHRDTARLRHKGTVARCEAVLCDQVQHSYRSRAVPCECTIRMVRFGEAFYDALLDFTTLMRKVGSTDGGDENGNAETDHGVINGPGANAPRRMPHDHPIVVKREEVGRPYHFLLQLIEHRRRDVAYPRVIAKSVAQLPDQRREEIPVNIRVESKVAVVGQRADDAIKRGPGNACGAIKLHNAGTIA